MDRKSLNPPEETIHFIKMIAQSEHFSVWTKKESIPVRLYGTSTSQLPSLMDEKQWEQIINTGKMTDNGYGYFAIKHTYILVTRAPLDQENGEERIQRNEHLLYSLIELEEKKRIEASYRLLMEVARVIASSIHDHQVLDLIIRSAVNAIPYADTGFLLLFDEKLQKLLVKSAVGFKEEFYRNTRLAKGEGISGRVFSTGSPLIINGTQKIAETMSNMTDDNLSYYLDSTMIADYPYSVVCVPLTYENQSLGVLTINNFTENTVFTSDDKQILQAFADNVAVAIFQIGLFHKEREQREELLLMHQALHKEHERLQRTIDLHNELTNIAAQGKGIDAILYALEKSVRMPLQIYDSLLNVKSSTQGKNKQLPQNFFNQPAVKLLLDRKKWQKLRVGEDVLILLPIFGPDYLLGFLCAWPPQRHDGSDVPLLLEYGATVLALEWTKVETIRETKARVKGEIIDQLLSGETTKGMMEQAEQLGLLPNQSYVILLSRLNPLREKKGSRVEKEKQRWISLIETIFTRLSLNVTVLFYGKHLLTIVSFDEKMKKQEMMADLKKGLHQLQEELPQLQSSVGRIYQGIHLLERSYRDAMSCFDLFERHPLPQSMLNYTELGAFRLFLEHDRQKLEQFLYDMLGSLLESDKEANKELTNTLVAYVIYDKQLQKVSEELNIHYNTIYYRLKRIQQILGYSFDDPSDWFNVQLACYVYYFFLGK